MTPFIRTSPRLADDVCMIVPTAPTPEQAREPGVMTAEEYERRRMAYLESRATFGFSCHRYGRKPTVTLYEVGRLYEQCGTIEKTARRLHFSHEHTRRLVARWKDIKAA